MARWSNRRKTVEAVSSHATSASGAACDSTNAANADSLLYLIEIGLVTGSITFKIQTSANDGATWHDLSTAEMTGNTGALNTTGNYHIATQAPFGIRTRLAYTIVTGPVEFDIYPIYEKGGSVY